MRQSQLFTKTRKEAPKDEVAKNAQLLIRAGYIHKEMAGVYAFLPLGLRVFEKVKTILREEMSAIGAHEISMTSLQRKELWEKTGRWDDKVVDVWFKSTLHAGGEVGFGWSHEEPITDMMKNYVSSFRDLPLYVYQFQNKLRNELRAKSGIMRGREFTMKDMYSYALNKEDHERFYSATIEAYHKVFARVGVGEDTFLTFAPGGAFTAFSHEFQTITDAGEDYIYINREKGVAINEEILNDETLANLSVTRDELERVKTAEVGNIFNFGTEKCEQLGLTYKDSEGKVVPVWLGSYGIGVTRLMGVVVEKFSDEKGIVWPAAIAPFQVHLVAIAGKGADAIAEADRMYEELTHRGVSVLYDDRDVRAGEKFADSDLLGIPLRMVISEKTMEKGGVELVDRATGTTTFVAESAILERLS
jgi:prolyl-tRNA synthetase